LSLGAVLSGFDRGSKSNFGSPEREQKEGYRSSWPMAEPLARMKLLLYNLGVCSVGVVGLIIDIITFSLGDVAR
jgi:hypothetical protein